MDERKRLYKSRNNKMICGVCAGIADYFNIDPSIVRVLWAVLALAAGTGGQSEDRPEHAHDRRVNVEVVCDACADAADHLVVAGLVKTLSFVHDRSPYPAARAATVGL